MLVVALDTLNNYGGKIYILVILNNSYAPAGVRRQKKMNNKKIGCGCNSIIDKTQDEHYSFIWCCRACGTWTPAEE